MGGSSHGPACGGRVGAQAWEPGLPLTPALSPRGRGKRGLVGCVLDARVDRYPVELPGLAAVVGEGLLEADGVGVDRGDDEAHQERAAGVVLLVEELAAPVAELADGGLGHRARRAVGEI